MPASERFRLPGPRPHPDRKSGKSTSHRTFAFRFWRKAKQTGIFRSVPMRFPVWRRSLIHTATEILEWGSALIRESINRRSVSQRNNPGSLARVGVSPGPRSAQMFGWVRNLKKRFLKGDRIDHDNNISSLSGLLYALIRSRAPSIANQYEAIMSSSGLPALDPTQSESFRLPLRPGHSVPFRVGIGRSSVGPGPLYVAPGRNSSEGPTRPTGFSTRRPDRPK